MAALFDCITDNIGLHLKNIFKSGELIEDSVTEKISATAVDGKNYLTKIYNLDAIIPVGYLTLPMEQGQRQSLFKGDTVLPASDKQGVCLLQPLCNV